MGAWVAEGRTSFGCKLWRCMGSAPCRAIPNAPLEQGKSAQLKETPAGLHQPGIEIFP